MSTDHRPSMTDLFRAVARAVPDRDALVHGELRRTFAELADRIERFATYLTAHGLGIRADAAGPVDSPHDHLALYLHNSPAYVEAMFGALAARLAPVNVNYRYTIAEVAALFGDARPAVIVFHSRYAPVIEQVAPELAVRPLLIQVEDRSGVPLLPGARWFDGILDTTEPGPVPATSPDDLYLVFTGGTTGSPKGVMWGQHDMWVAAAGGAEHPCGITAKGVASAVTQQHGPRLLAVAPFMHGAGGWYMIRVLLGGGTVVIPGRTDRFDPAEACILIDREGIDTLVLVGEAFARLFADEIDRGSYALSSVRLIGSGGGPSTTQTKRRLIAAMPAATFMDSAGSSETGGILRAYLTMEGEATTAFVLSPRACVVSDDLSQIFGDGEEGDGWLAAREPLPRGYLHAPEKTATTFVTVSGERVAVIGDRVRVQPDSRVELLGRAATTINTGGEKVFAEEVERALLAVPGVFDALVVGRPDERWGQAVVAVVHHSTETSGVDFHAALAETLARYKIPKQFISVPGIRRSAAGKPDYPWARSIATSRVGAPS